MSATFAGQASVTRRARVSSSGARRFIMPTISSAMRATSRVRSSGVSEPPSARSMPRSHAICLTGSSTRMSLPASSTSRRPPTAIAAVATMWPRSITANLVVPPPMSTLSSRTPLPADSAHGAGAMRRHLAFHVVAGRGADEPARLFRKQIGNGARVAPLERLAGQNDGAAVDARRLNPGEDVAAADEAGELVDVDGVVGAIGREQDRRLPDHLAIDDDEPARQRRRRRCRCTRANIRCEVDDPTSMPTVVSSTLSAAQATSFRVSPGST